MRREEWGVDSPIVNCLLSIVNSPRCRIPIVLIDAERQRVWRMSVIFSVYGKIQVESVVLLEKESPLLDKDEQRCSECRGPEFEICKVTS